MTGYINRPSTPFNKTQNKKGTLFSKPDQPDEVMPPNLLVKGEETEAAIRDSNLVNASGVEQFVKNSLAQSLSRVNENNNISQLLPDMKLALEIIIGTMLAPKDMMTTTLTFSTNDTTFAEKGAGLIKVVQEYFLKSYKIKEQLEPMLWEILAKSGAYPEVILPETSIDYIINSDSNITMESLKVNGVVDKNSRLFSLGVLGSNESHDHESSILDILENVSTEGQFNTPKQFNDVVVHECLKLTVTDNFDGLKFPELKQRVAQRLANDAINRRRSFGHGLESHAEAMRSYYDTQRDTEEEKNLRQLYPNRAYKNTPILRVKTKDQLGKETKGHPKVFKYATESVIPVYNSSDPSSHVGYFIAIDNTGAGLRLSAMDDLYRIVSSNSNATSNMNVVGNLLNQAQTSVTGQPGMQDNNPQSVVPIYQSMVERDLLDRLSNGVYGSGWSFGENQYVYEMMLMRALAGKTTQLMFVPASLMSYGAVEYDDFGLGKTLFDDSKLLAAMRSLNLITNSIANTKNAITKRGLNIELDKAEKEPAKALGIIRNEYIKGTQAEFPITNSINDQIKYIQEAGIQINLGEHPLLPNSKFSVDYQDNQYRVIDTTYDDWLRDAHARALGVSPEIIEGAGSADFATQTVIANVLTQRRIQKLSEKFSTEKVTDFVRKYTYNSQPLMDELTRLVEQNNIVIKDDEGKPLPNDRVAVRFLDSLEVKLPPVDSTSVKEQKEAFTETKELYEEAIEMFVSSDFITGADLGDLAEDVDQLKAFLVSHHMRNWMRTNGVMPELFDMLTRNSEGKPVMDLAKIRNDFMTTMIEVIKPAMKASMKRSGDVSADIEKYKESLTNPPGEGDDMAGGESTDGGDFGGDGDMGGGDDPDANMDFDAEMDGDANEENAEAELDTEEKDEDLKKDEESEEP